MEAVNEAGFEVIRQLKARQNFSEASKKAFGFLYPSLDLGHFFNLPSIIRSSRYDDFYGLTT
ncbi:MAG: hypothetical protein ACKOEW_12170 [Methylocystis sp.]